MAQQMTEQEAIDRARSYFLTDDNIHGCAETTLMVLQQAFALPNATDSAPAMALNGGVAWDGGICGAITGSAMAVGRLSAGRIEEHRPAKQAARRIIARLNRDFRAEHGHINCRDLVGLDISSPEGHAEFIESKAWHGACMRQIEFAVERLVSLQDERAWQETLKQIEDAE